MDEDEEEADEEEDLQAAQHHTVPSFSESSRPQSVQCSVKSVIDARSYLSPQSCEVKLP